jgi:hypothetical protein
VLSDDARTRRVAFTIDAGVVSTAVNGSAFSPMVAAG